MTKFDKAHHFIDFLQTQGYDGNLRIQTDSYSFKMLDGIVPTTTRAKIVTKGIKKTPVKTTLPVTTTIPGDKPLDSIAWGRPGSTKDWKKICMGVLLKYGVNSINQLQNITYEELQHQKSIGNIADIIRDSLKRAGYSLKAH